MFSVTLDVTLLYNNISNHKEIKAAKEALNSLKQKRCRTGLLRGIKFLLLLLDC